MLDAQFNPSKEPAMGKVDELMGLVSKLESHSWNAGKNSALADIEGETGSQEPAWQAEQALTLGASLKAKLRTALSACVAEWRPISEAPRDGTPIWALDSLYCRPWHYECIWNGIEWYHGFGDAWPTANPTHYQPLPPPPTETEGETK